MTGLANQLAQEFGALLLAPLPPQQELSSRVLEDISAPHARLALDANGLRHLLVAVPASPKFRSDRASDGVQYEHRQWVEDAQKLSFLDIVCRKPHLNDLFCLLAAEILEALVHDASRPERTAARSINRWRELLARPASGRLDPNVLVGLFGELTCLRLLVDRSPGALALWTGPSGSGHDFRTRGASLEVKSTTSRRGWSFQVHGLDQLADPVEGTLHLALFRLEDTSEGHSVPDLMAELVGLGVDAAELHEKVARAKLGPDQMQAASDIRFRVLEWRLYHVKSGFPRLVAAHLVGGKAPVGVTHIHYGLDLTAWSDPPLSPNEVESFFNALVAAP